jgi:hypothetical protein
MKVEGFLATQIKALPKKCPAHHRKTIAAEIAAVRFAGFRASH